MTGFNSLSHLAGFSILGGAVRFSAICSDEKYFRVYVTHTRYGRVRVLLVTEEKDAASDLYWALSAKYNRAYTVIKFGEI
jgi:hypothetical protein